MRYFVAFVLALCAGTALGAGTFLTGKFVEKYSSDPHAFLNGTFYYYYENSNATKSRLRFVYNMPNGQTVANLYHFEIGAMYSMCSTCAADTRTMKADKWWYDSSVYTRTNEQENGKYWYVHTTVKPEDQVTRILMTDATTPTASSLAAIEFKDGRSIRVSEVQVNPGSLSASSAVFQLDSNLNCPVPTCSMFADIIFVLDYSGSVSQAQWTQLSQFVIGVLQSFKFGDNEAAAACVKFTSSASVLVGGKYNGKDTVTTDVATLISVMNVTRKPSGNTFMGAGFNLAGTLLSNSPRRLYGNKPQNIVIAVTDGQDCCTSDLPAKTKTAADKLKAAPYEAFIMTIGVGSGVTSTSAVKTLKSLASTVNGEPAYFHVDNYNQIKSYVDRVFSPLCEQFHSECGLDCKGFCGCGECLCPYCDSTGGKCTDYRCVARAGTSNGCVMTPLLDCPADDKCVQHKCDETSGNAQCKDVYTCQAYYDKNPGTCRTVSCNVNNGQCTVTLNNNKCEKFNTPCETWVCAGENETAMDAETGCKISRNKTQECQGTSTCMSYSCDINTGNCITKDLCESRNHKCSTFTCNTKTNQCDEHPISAPVDLKNTSCLTSKCDELTGWYPFHTKTAEECRGTDDDPCKEYYCDVNNPEGCTYDVIWSCGPKCKGKVDECKANALQTSTLEQCKKGFCYVHDVGGDTVADCDYNVTNCFESDEFVNATELNKNDPNVCYTVECAEDGCKLKSLDIPTEPGKEDTKCWKNVCVRDDALGFKWVRQPTTESETCVSDECATRVCDDALGCVPTDICSPRSNDCKTYKCQFNDGPGTGKCVFTLNPVRDLECFYEECPEDKMIKRMKNLTEVCQNEDKCLVPECTTDGYCKFVPATPPEGMFKPDQLECVVCDSKTGIFSFACDDGLFCTNDICAVNAQCRHTEIDCYNELNMSSKNPKDYCFQPECEEKSTKYQCKRKKKAGTFIDICGRCVDENGEPYDKDDSGEGCSEPGDDPIPKEPLAAATIAMIVLGAILIGAAIAMSSILGTKALMERAKAANNQSAHSNPLFEDNGKEMANPTFMEEVDVEG